MRPSRRHPEDQSAPREFLPSLGTHFNARVDLPTLEQIRAFHFRWARLDCQTCPIETMLAMIDDTDRAALHPLPIVYDLERLEACAFNLAVTDVEWGNEPDGDITPASYREGLEAACALTDGYGLCLYAPALSNLDRDSLRWLELVRGAGWPPGLHGISVHRYGDGTFEFAHDGFDSRDDEVRRLLELCDGLPFIVTEFGYPTDTPPRPTRQAGEVYRAKRAKFLKANLFLTEEQAAANIAKEWEFWRNYTDRPFLYQINDGPNAGETYGIRRCLPDGTLTDWKPAAYQVPQEELPMPETGDATYCISRSQSFPFPGKDGAFCTYYPKGQTETILSIQPDGTKEMRPATAAGAWETWIPSKDGNRAVFIEAAEFYAIPLVD